MIKIIGGIKKRTNIEVPLDNVRPTSAQKRESIFSIIESYATKIEYNIYKKANVIDLSDKSDNWLDDMWLWSTKKPKEREFP